MRHCVKCIIYKAFVGGRQLVLCYQLFLHFAHEGVCHEGTQKRAHSYTVHFFVQVSFKLEELIFGGDSQQFHQLQLRDVKIVLSVKPVIFKGSLCESLDGFIHLNISEQ